LDNRLESAVIQHSSHADTFAQSHYNKAVDLLLLTDIAAFLDTLNQHSYENC